MTFAHITHDQLARDWMAITLVALGIFQLRSPGCFESIRLYFRGAWAGLSNEQIERLESVIEARARAEGAGGSARYAGLFTIAMDSSPCGPRSIRHAVRGELLGDGLCHVDGLSKVPPRNRFAFCAARAPHAARSTSAGGDRFRGALSDRNGRVCELSAVSHRRRAGRRFDDRLGRDRMGNAGAPAVLFGTDPQVEYAVDKRVRFCRATGLITLACAPPTVFAAFAWRCCRRSPAFSS